MSQKPFIPLFWKLRKAQHSVSLEVCLPPGRKTPLSPEPDSRSKCMFTFVLSKGHPNLLGSWLNTMKFFLFNLTRIAVLRMITKALSGNLQGQNNSVVILRYYFPFISVSASTMMVQEHWLVKLLEPLHKPKAVALNFPGEFCVLDCQCIHRIKKKKLYLKLALKRQPNLLILLHLNSWEGEGNGTPLQYCCLENPMDGGAWWAAVHGVAKSQTWLSDFTFTFHFHALEKEMATHSSVLA